MGNSLRVPRVGDKVNDITRRPNANGHVMRVLREDGWPTEIIVKYANGLETYDFDEFHYTYTDAYGGCYILHNNHRG